MKHRPAELGEERRVKSLVDGEERFPAKAERRKMQKAQSGLDREVLAGE
jgi:hypothetical protein